MAKGIDNPQVAAEFEEHANDEQIHMMLIAERIDQLGGDPDFNPATVTSRASTEYGASEELTGMIAEDLVAERVVIEIYRKLIKWSGDHDPTSRRIFEKVLADEEESRDQSLASARHARSWTGARRLNGGRAAREAPARWRTPV